MNLFRTSCTLVGALAAVGLLLSSPSIRAATGVDVMQKVQDRYVGEDSKALMQMVLVSQSGREKERKLLFISKDYGKDSKLLIKFVEPRQLKNTGLLIYSFADDENLQWLYLSGAGKKEPRKIPATDKDDSFLGSEFYYVDFEENQATDFEHKVIKEEQFDGYSTVVVESIPKKSDYPYSKTVSWVDKATDVVVKVDIYMNDQFLKTITVSKMEKREGIDTPLETVVVNHQNGKKSYLRVEKIKYNNELNDDAFTQEQLVRDL
jgi:outer membrane lipoprotein-sorting protein